MDLKQLAASLRGYTRAQVALGALVFVLAAGPFVAVEVARSRSANHALRCNDVSGDVLIGGALAISYVYALRHKTRWLVWVAEDYFHMRRGELLTIPAILLAWIAIDAFRPGSEIVTYPVVLGSWLVYSLILRRRSKAATIYAEECKNAEHVR